MQSREHATKAEELAAIAEDVLRLVPDYDAGHPHRAELIAEAAAWAAIAQVHATLGNRT